MFHPLPLSQNVPSLATTVEVKCTCPMSAPSPKNLSPLFLQLRNLLIVEVVVIVDVVVLAIQPKVVALCLATVVFGLIGKPNLHLLASRKSVILTVLFFIGAAFANIGGLHAFN